jgi:hypothetical protein
MKNKGIKFFTISNILAMIGIVVGIVFGSTDKLERWISSVQWVAVVRIGCHIIAGISVLWLLWKLIILIRQERAERKRQKLEAIIDAKIQQHGEQIKKLIIAMEIQTLAISKALQQLQWLGASFDLSQDDIEKSAASLAETLDIKPSEARKLLKDALLNEFV